MFENEKQDDEKTCKDLKLIMPLKDFKIRCNQYSYDLKKGEKLEVHKMFLQNLKTEKVIK